MNFNPARRTKMAAFAFGSTLSGAQVSSYVDASAAGSRKNGLTTTPSSTKTGALMRSLTRKVSPVSFQERFPGKSPPHGVLIAILLSHALLQETGQQARDAGLSSSGFEPSPAGDVFFQSDGNVSQTSFHDTNVV
jgi:hypothetical protein